MIPSDRASPSFAATATAIVSAWTSKPTNFILFIDRLLSHVALRCDLPIHSVTHGLRIGAGRSIVTTGNKEPQNPKPPRAGSEPRPLQSNAVLFRISESRILRVVIALKFGTDGWRGVIAEDVTHENVRLVAYAIARYVVRCESPQAGVVVGYDTRFASERFARVAAEAVALTGTAVWLGAEACPTPAVSLLVKLRGAAGGIQITASHNPARWSGVKYKASFGGSASPAIVAQIESELAVVVRDGVPPLPPRKDLIHSLDARPPYLETLAKLVDWDRIRAANFRFVADPMYGSGRGLLRGLMTRNGVAWDEIRGKRDPLFGGVNPEPIEPHIDALRTAVVAGKYDAGLACDGDADRIGAVDRDGTFITPHQIFAILLWHLAGTRKISGDVVKTFSTTKLIDKIPRKFGGKFWKRLFSFS